MARILIANDDRDLLDLCGNILEECGHVVQIAATAGLRLSVFTRGALT
jgi:hypothetical protein